MARDDGYQILFDDEKAKEELKIPAVHTGTIWDILFADIGDTKTIHEVAGGNFTGPDTNKLQNLKDDFSCLKITLRYTRELRHNTGAKVDEKVVLQWEEVHWLHDIAQDLFMERFRLKEYRSLLAMSGLSLCAIHVSAIAIRGINSS